MHEFFISYASPLTLLGAYVMSLEMLLYALNGASDLSLFIDM